MRQRALLSLLVLILSSVTCRAQQTTVTATVVDPNGFVYQFLTGAAFINCPGNQAPLYNGFTVPRNYTITGADGNGHFTLVLYDVNAITPSGCSYNFAITAQNGFTNFTATAVGGSGSATPITGSGPVDLSTPINAFAVPLPITGALPGTIGVNQVAFGVSLNKIGGSTNFLYNTTGTPNALALNMPGASCTGLGVNQHGCALIELTNSSATTPFFVSKQIDNSIIFVNSDEAIPTHGWFGYDTRGNYFNISGGTGTQMQLLGAPGGILPTGSVLFQMPENGSLTTVFVINQPSNVTNAGAWQFHGLDGVTSWFPENSTVATVVLTPPTVGSTPTAVPLELTATSSAFATATTAGTCVQNTTAVTGATTSMVPLIAPVSTPGVGAVWSAFVSSAGNVTINECAVATSAGGSIAFNIRVIE